MREGARLIPVEHLSTADAEGSVPFPEVRGILQGIAKMTGHPVHAALQFWPGQFVMVTVGTWHERSE